MGHANVVVTNNDPEDFQRLPVTLMRLVVDAPARRRTFFRKDPEAMTRMVTRAVERCSQRQRRILHDIWPSLRQTVSSSTARAPTTIKENEDNLIWLEQAERTESVELKIILPGVFRK